MSVRIWLIDYSSADLNQLGFRKQSPLQKYFEADSAASDEVRLQNYVRDVSLRYALSQEYPLRFDEWSFGKTALGKPYLTNWGFEDLKFSISHSGKHLAIILTSESNKTLSNVGIDIEPTSRARQAEKLKDEFLSEKELFNLNRLPDSELASVILKLWTLKESISKALGLGLCLPFSSINLEVSGQNQVQLISFADENLYEVSEFFLKSCEPKPGLQLAYCLQGQSYVDQAPQILILNFSEVLNFCKLMPILKYA